MAATLRFLNPGTMEKPPGYTHVIEVTGPCRTVYIAGQLGVDRTGKLVSEDFAGQVTQAFENLKSALAAVGAEFKDVAKIVNYVTDMSHIKTYQEIRNTYLNQAAPPVSTLVEIPRLARPGAMFEIEAIAVLPP